MSNAVLSDLFVLMDSIKKQKGLEDRKMTVLQLAVLLFCLLPDLLCKGLSQEDKPVLLQVLATCLLLYSDVHVFLFCSILWPVGETMPIRRPTHRHITNYYYYNT